MNLHSRWSVGLCVFAGVLAACAGQAPCEPGPGQCGAGADGGAAATSTTAEGGAGGAGATTAMGGSGGETGTGGAGGAATTSTSTGTGGSDCGVCEDTNPCTIDTCFNGACLFQTAPAGAPCPGGKCDNNKTCIKDPTCNDGLHNGGESDVDCGGPCPLCSTGKKCYNASDCQIDLCTNGVCQCPPVDHLLITEVRANPPDGAAPGFIEIMNPMPTVFNNEVSLNINGSKWIQNLVLNPGERFVFGGPGVKTGWISLTINNGASQDVFCYCVDFWCDQAPAPMCNGAQFENPVPSGAAASLERKPVGANCIDTNNTVADFVPQAVATPGF